MRRLPLLRAYHLLAAFVVIVGFALSRSASAAEVYGNGDASRSSGGSGAAANLNNQNFQAINFNTGSSSLLGLNEGWLLLRNSTGGTVNLTVEIYSDGSSGPSTTLLGTTSLTVLNDGADSWRHFTFSAPLTGLAAGTDYWLVLSSPSTVAVNWLKPTTGASSFDAISGSGYAAPSSLYRANSTTGTTWSLGSPAEMGMQLGAVSAIPEPSTYALLGGAACLTIAIFRKRKGVTTSSATPHRSAA